MPEPADVSAYQFGDADEETIADEQAALLSAYQVGDADEETTADEQAALLQEVMAVKASAETLTTSLLFKEHLNAGRSGTTRRSRKWTG